MGKTDRFQPKLLDVVRRLHRMAVDLYTQATTLHRNNIGPESFSYMSATATFVMLAIVLQGDGRVRSSLPALEEFAALLDDAKAVLDETKALHGETKALHGETAGG